MGMGTNGVIQGNFHEHPHEFYREYPKVCVNLQTDVR